MYRRKAVTLHILSADGTRVQIPGIVQIHEDALFIYLSTQTGGQLNVDNQGSILMQTS